MATEKLDSILRNYVATDRETKGKLIGASFVVVNKDGKFTHPVEFHNVATADTLYTL
jgi:hypothetical protein